MIRQRALAFFLMWLSLISLSIQAFGGPALTPYLTLQHVHTGGYLVGYDDGDKSIAQRAQYCRENGIHILVITIHAKAVDDPYNKINDLNTYVGKTGMGNIIKDCKDNSGPDLTIIAGIEFGDDTNGNSHFLAINFQDPETFKQALEIYNKDGQLPTINFLIEHGIRVIIAHPDFHLTHPDRNDTKKTAETRYAFDFTQAPENLQGITGIGLFNNGNNIDDTLWTNLLHILGPSIMWCRTIMGDSDIHTDGSEIGDKVNEIIYGKKPFPGALRRRSVAWSASLKTADIMQSITCGQTAAYYAVTDKKALELPEGYVPGTGWIYYDQNHKIEQIFPLKKGLLKDYYWLKVASTNGQDWTVTKLLSDPKNTQDIVLLDTATHHQQYYILVLNTKDYILVGSPLIMYNLAY